MPCQEGRYADPRHRGRPGADLRVDRAARRRPPLTQAQPRSRPTPRRRPRVQHRGRLVRRVRRGPGPADRRPATGRGRRRRGDAVRAAHLGRARDDHGRRRRPHRPVHHHDRQHRSPGGRSPRLARLGRLLAEAVDGLCEPAGRRRLLDRRRSCAWPAAGAGRPGPGDARRGRPAAGRRRDAPVGRHRAARRRGTTPPRPAATTRTSGPAR